MEGEPLIISLDIDGTVTDSDNWPHLGQVRAGVKEFVDKIIDAGYCVIINTCREGVHADAAKALLKEHGIRYMHFNENCHYMVNKYGDCRKVSATVFIDDHGIMFLEKDFDWDKLYNSIVSHYGTGPCVCRNILHTSQ